MKQSISVKLAVKLVIVMMIGMMIGGALMAGPIMSPDGVALDPGDPGIGRQVFAVPGSTWAVFFNDNWGNDGPGTQFGAACDPSGYGCDFDYNDAQASVLFGPSYFGFVQVTVRYVASAGGNDDDIKLAGSLGPWLDPGQSQVWIEPANSLVTIKLMDESTNRIYYSGLAAGNPDGIAHAWTSGADVPEPGTLLISGIGLIALGCWKRKREGISR